MTDKPLVFWGAAGHAKVLQDCTAQLGYRVIALFDNRPGLQSPLAGVPLYVGWQEFLEWSRGRNLREVAFLIAIGGDRGADRVELATRLAHAGLRPISVIHPTAFVAGSAGIAPGCQVLARAVVGVEARLGEQTIINTAASVDHECILGRGVHVAPGATVCGTVTIGDFVLVGAGAVVLPRLRIGEGAVIGGGAVVTNDVEPGAIVVGNPARLLQRKAA